MRNFDNSFGKNSTFGGTIKTTFSNPTESFVNSTYRSSNAIRNSIDINNVTNNLDDVLFKVSMRDSVSLDGCAGAVVFCNLAIILEHSGIYIGNKRIVELNGDGYIREIDYSTFLNDSLFRTGLNIFTFTDLNGNVLYSRGIAYRAEFRIGEKKNYNLIFENCHKFSAGCISGNFENIRVTFNQLLNLILETYGPFEIRKVEL